MIDKLIIAAFFTSIIYVGVEVMKSSNSDLKKLKKIKYKIAFWGLEKQSKYADEVCVESINDIDFIAEQMDSIPILDASFFENLNTTSVGNLAFLVLNAPKEHSEKAHNIIIKYQEYIKKNNLL